VKNKTVHVTYGLRNRDIFKPACDLTRMAVEFKSRNLPSTNLVPSDLAIFSKYGYEIHYTGNESRTLDGMGAIHDDE
jgi:hypothetical protein